MALIKCTECGNDVSEYAEKCPNCGCPIEMIQNILLNNMQNKILCVINNNTIDISWIINELKKLSKEEFDHYRYIYTQSISGQKQSVKCTTEYINSENRNILFKANQFSKKVSEQCNLEYKTTEKFLHQLIESNFELKEFNGESYEQWRTRQQASINSIPKCPMCGTTNIKKISTLNRTASVVGLGILSKKIGKQWQCNNPKCKHMW